MQVIMIRGENEIEPLTVNQLEELRSLSEKERNQIDRMLYAATDRQWRKVAFVVSGVILASQ